MIKNNIIIYYIEKKIKRKSKSRKRSNLRSKISQKVIQKVIVNIAEQKKAKKVRRRQKRKFQREAEDLQLQQPSVPATVVYNTGAAFVPPLLGGASIIIPQPVSVKKPQYIEVEEPSGIIEVPTKREQLSDLMTPVPLPEENISNSIFTEPIYVSRERVEGNYSFDKPDMYYERPPASLTENQTTFKKRFIPQSLGEFLMSRPEEEEETMSNITATELSEVKQPIKISKRRSTEDIANARRDELFKLYVEGVGLARDKSEKLVAGVENKNLADEIRKAKNEIRGMGRKIPK